MAGQTLYFHIRAEDAPQVSRGGLISESRVSVEIMLDRTLEPVFIGTPDQLEAIGCGILAAIGRPVAQDDEIIRRVENCATVDQALAILRAAMLREPEFITQAADLLTRAEPLAEVSIEEAIERG